MNGILIIWLLVAIVLTLAYAAYQSNKKNATCVEDLAFDERMFKGAMIVVPIVGIVLTIVYLLL